MQVVSPQLHANKKWHRPGSYEFAGTAQSVPVTAEELARSALSFPLAVADNGGQPTLVALMGLRPQENLFVGARGKWIGRYVPAVLQAFPFHLAPSDGSTVLLCVDETSGLVTDLAVGEGGVPFFVESGEPSQETKKVADFLAATHRGIQQQQQAVGVLAECGLLAPWPLRIKDGAIEKTIAGMSRIDEAKLNGLSADELAKLRDAGALALAYGQLLSMGNVPILSALSVAHQRLAHQKAARMAIPEGSFLVEEEDSIKIDWNDFLKDREG